jgi:hypothetical protein
MTVFCEELIVIQPLLKKLKFHHHVHKSPLLNHGNHLNIVCAFTCFFSKSISMQRPNFKSKTTHFFHPLANIKMFIERNTQMAIRE